MENQQQKWVNISFLGAAALTAYVFFALAVKISAVYDLEAHFGNWELILRVSSIVIGAGLFLVLYKNPRTNQFTNEVVAELARVTWPTRKETTSATFIVIIMVLISGMVLGLLDYVWTKVMQWIL